MAEHKRLSASTFSRNAGCPGSPERCDIAPPSPDTRYSREGTTVHFVAHQTLMGAPPAIGSRCAESGEIIASDHHGSARDYVAECMAHIQQSDLWASEQTLDMAWLHKDVGGTPDFWALRRDEWLVVVDEKNGYEPADADLQLTVYTVGKVQDLWRAGHHIAGIVMVVVQPNCSDPMSRRSVKSFTDVEAWFGRACNELSAIIAATEAPNAQRIPGKHCHYCDGKVVCPEHKARLALLAAELFQRSNVAPNSISPQDVAAELEFLVELKSLTNERAKAVNQYGFFLADRGGQAIPGHKLTEKYSNRVYTDEEAVAQLARTMGVTDENIFTLKTPAQLEKFLPKNVLDGLTEQTVTGKSLKPMGGKGAPTIASIHKWFNHTEQ